MKKQTTLARLGSNRDLAALKSALLEEKREIQMEINSYPAPIAGCDQQFNHLLQRRAEVKQKLREIESTLGTNAREGD